MDEKDIEKLKQWLYDHGYYAGSSEVAKSLMELADWFDDYEEKYKEARERMKSLVRGEHPECFCEAQKAAEFIFPELKESEDEQMIERLKSCVYASDVTPEGREEIFSWLEKQGKQKQTWEPNTAQLIVIKDLIEDKNTSKVNKVILQGMFDDIKQFTNSHKREIDDAYLQGICDAKYEIEKQGKKLDAAEVIEWLDEHVPTKFEDMQNYVQQFKQDFGL